MSPPEEHTPVSEDAEVIFLAFLERGEGETFEGLIRRHPQLASDLALLHETWLWMERFHGGEHEEGSAESTPSTRSI